MELKKLIKNTSYLVSTKIVKFLVGIIRAKLIAMFLGLHGAGIIAQLQDIVEKLARFTLMSINDGLVKQIAENRESEGFKSKLAELLKAYIFIIIPLVSTSLILLFVFSKEITIFIFGNIKYYNYFMIGLISFPVLVINSISFALLKGFKKIKYIARSELIVILVNFISFILLVYFGGITGAVIFVPISLLTILMVNSYYAKTKVLKNYKIKIKEIFSANIKCSVVKELFVFAGFGITTGTVVVFLEIASRSIVVTKLGIAQIGIYTPIITWASLFTGFLLPSISTYLYPRFSEAKANPEIRAILNDVLRLISFSMIPLLFLSIPIRFQIIPLFYSAAFIEAGKYSPGHFIGILFYLWMAALSIVLTPTGRIKIFSISLIIRSLLDFFVVYYFVPIYGLYGWMLKFMVSPILFFFIYFFYLYKVINLRITINNIFVMIFVLGGSIIIIGFDKYISHNYIISLSLGFFFTFLSILFLSANEKQYILTKLKINRK